MSDIHATAGPLRQALKIFAQNSVDLILCAGDIAGYGTELEQCIKLLLESDCVSILGNHDRWYMDHNLSAVKTWAETFLHNLPLTWESTIAGKRIFVVHGSPAGFLTRGITLLDQNEHIMSNARDHWLHELEGYDFDVLVVGHTHQVFAEMLGHILVINPGSTKFNNTCTILSLPDKEVRVFSLLNIPTRKVWHWGMML